MYICPKCGSASVSVERRIDGDATCSYCGFKGKAVTFLTRKVQQLEAVRQEKVQHLDDIGQVIQDTRDVYEKGGIEGIIIIIKNKEEGCTQTAICGNISLLTKA